MTLREIKDIEEIVNSYSPVIIAKFDAILDAELSGDLKQAESLKSLLSPGEKTYYVVYLANSDRVIPFKEDHRQQTPPPILYTRETRDSQLRGYDYDSPAGSLSNSLSDSSRSGLTNSRNGLTSSRSGLKSSYETVTPPVQYFDLNDEEPDSPASDNPKKDCRIM